MIIDTSDGKMRIRTGSNVSPIRQKQRQSDANELIPSDSPTSSSSSSSSKAISSISNISTINKSLSSVSSLSSPSSPLQSSHAHDNTSRNATSDCNKLDLDEHRNLICYKCSLADSLSLSKNNRSSICTIDTKIGTDDETASTRRDNDDTHECVTNYQDVVVVEDEKAAPSSDDIRIVSISSCDEDKLNGILMLPELQEQQLRYDTIDQKRERDVNTNTIKNTVVNSIDQDNRTTIANFGSTRKNSKLIELRKKRLASSLLFRKLKHKVREKYACADDLSNGNNISISWQEKEQSAKLDRSSTPDEESRSWDRNDERKTNIDISISTQLQKRQVEGIRKSEEDTNTEILTTATTEKEYRMFSSKSVLDEQLRNELDSLKTEVSILRRQQAREDAEFHFRSKFNDLLQHGQYHQEEEQQQVRQEKEVAKEDVMYSDVVIEKKLETSSLSSKTGDSKTTIEQLKACLKLLETESSKQEDLECYKMGLQKSICKLVKTTEELAECKEKNDSLTIHNTELEAKVFELQKELDLLKIQSEAKCKTENNATKSKDKDETIPHIQNNLDSTVLNSQINVSLLDGDAENVEDSSHVVSTPSNLPLRRRWFSRFRRMEGEEENINVEKTNECKEEEEEDETSHATEAEVNVIEVQNELDLSKHPSQTNVKNEATSDETTLQYRDESNLPKEGSLDATSNISQYNITIRDDADTAEDDDEDSNHVVLTPVGPPPRRGWLSRFRRIEVEEEKVVGEKINATEEAADDEKETEELSLLKEENIALKKSLEELKSFNEKETNMKIEKI